jgi:hypothetical protein
MQRLLHSIVYVRLDVADQGVPPVTEYEKQRLAQKARNKVNSTSLKSLSIQ